MSRSSPTGAACLITVVTPSLNQGRFIRQTIDSVRSQSHPHVEHLVVDGGSTDETPSILAEYGHSLRWVSEEDLGQSAAINRGFREARGEILTWLNSDDVYEPGTLEAVARAFAENPEVGMIYGRGFRIDEAGRRLGPFEGTEPVSLWRLLHFLDYVLQPAAFFRASALRKAGLLDESLHWAMDWDLWIRLAASSEVLFLDRPLASAREHDASKTSTGGRKRIGELGRLTRRHAGRFWTPGVQCYALDNVRRLLRRRAPRFLHASIDRLVAAAISRIEASLPVHADGWLGPHGCVVVPRRWGGALLDLEVHRLPPSGRLTLQVSSSPDRHQMLELDRIGRHHHEVSFPLDGPGPFAEIRLDSRFWFRSPGDRRRLCVRCLGVKPGSLPAGR